MKVALLCSGLGHIHRGHEVFARDLFALLRGHVDMTLFKGGGAAGPNEIVIDNLPRLSPLLANVHVAVSPRWLEAAREHERQRIEAETFAYASLRHLMEGGFDVVHCLEQEVCNVIFANRHLFARPPKVLFSNGGAIPAAELPNCDAVQEHTAYNMARSDRRRAFLIPHGVDTERFRPREGSTFREQHGIPGDKFLMLSVGLICYWHKRMDHLIRELAPLPDVHLAIVGQEGPDTPEIKDLGHRLMPNRITFTTMAHDDLWQAYAAADAFVLGSLEETFGIVYIEAMAMQLPVFCTNHPNQQSIVQHGVFVDMAREGALRTAVATRDKAHLDQLALKGRDIVLREFDLGRLRQAYTEHYARLAAAPSTLPVYRRRDAVAAHTRNLLRSAKRTWHSLIR
jgi:glycosyltransferase involved in cell wall biosynthesis